MIWHILPWNGAPSQPIGLDGELICPGCIRLRHVERTVCQKNSNGRACPLSFRVHRERPGPIPANQPKQPTPHPPMIPSSHQPGKEALNANNISTLMASKHTL